MVSKEKRQKYNRKYYLKQKDVLDTIDEKPEEHVDEMKQIVNAKPHILMGLFFHLFHFIKIGILKFIKTT